MKQKFSQTALIMEWLKKHKTITPAKMGGHIYKGAMFGSESTKRCRELRLAGILGSFRSMLPSGKQDKFVTFFKIQ